MENHKTCERPKKIGIMTFHWAHNYGAVLQAYALSQYLSKRHLADVSIIDFRTRRQKNLNKILPRIVFDKNVIKSLAYYFITLSLYKSLNKRKLRFIKFSNEFFSYTRHYDSCAEIVNSPPVFDYVITGSDQVFNYRILPEEEFRAYCLAPFCSNKIVKIAYAPSFGNASISDTVISTMTESLKEFKFLSAREQDGAMQLQHMTGNCVPTVVDPVLLLDAEEWKALSKPIAKIKSPYILCYALNGRRFLGEMADRIKELTGLPIVLLTSNTLTRIKSDVTVYDAGPQEFVWLVENANYVVSDSFHGLVFSSIFEKNFYGQIANQMGAERIYNFLRTLSLETRIINKIEEINVDTMSIDFSNNKKILSRLIQKSKEYLEVALS